MRSKVTAEWFEAERRVRFEELQGSACDVLQVKSTYLATLGIKEGYAYGHEYRVRTACK
jgi:hypothetical protein